MKHRPVAVAGEPGVGAVEVRGVDVDVASPAVEQRPAAPGADQVAGERARHGGHGRHDERDDEAPRRVGQRLEHGRVRGRLADLPARHRHDDLGRDDRDERLERDRDRHPDVADRVVQAEEEGDDLPIDELEHALYRSPPASTAGGSPPRRGRLSSGTAMRRCGGAAAGAAHRLVEAAALVDAHHVDRDDDRDERGAGHPSTQHVHRVMSAAGRRG